MIIGIIGSGAMGSGIAQVAAMAGDELRIFDNSRPAQTKALQNIQESINKFVTKGILSASEGVAVIGRIYICDHIDTMYDCDLVIEAIIEDLATKKQLFQSLEKIVTKDCIIATNTSSFSITSMAASLNHPERCIGIHFFNPPVLMQLVELIPAIQTKDDITKKVKDIIEFWGKTDVVAKDTPGFIVNKVARPFYSEAIRIFEEGISDTTTIDYAMTRHGFKMGPFKLMDFIGHDVNYRVTESIWKAFYYDSKYRPSLTQLRLFEAGHFGLKSNRGFYIYPQNNELIHDTDDNVCDEIFLRIISMLVNEAADTVHQNICSPQDVDLAVRLGVNYPKGLLAWGKEIGYGKIVNKLDQLFDLYHEERYRVSPYLKKLYQQN
ncbi:MAG: 3-hydroxybutyryl-CoA dehydrogenase [Saprospiraceae bacterium]|nr:3-hydroxybutyryl-CoA dehydrogenase [Saprospiraceae bacterium]